jgi:hypothetical protein
LQQEPPEKDGDDSFEAAAVPEEEPLPAVLKMENCWVCCLLPHFGQTIGDLLDITSFS